MVCFFLSTVLCVAPLKQNRTGLARLSGLCVVIFHAQHGKEVSVKQLEETQSARVDDDQEDRFTIDTYIKLFNSGFVAERKGQVTNYISVETYQTYLTGNR